MTNDLTITLLICVATFLIGYVIAKLAKRSNLRHGWEAYHNGLPVNLNWGRDICGGWYMASRGEPRP